MPIATKSRPDRREDSRDTSRRAPEEVRGGNKEGRGHNVREDLERGEVYFVKPATIVPRLG